MCNTPMTGRAQGCPGFMVLHSEPLHGWCPLKGPLAHQASCAGCNVMHIMRIWQG